MQKTIGQLEAEFTRAMVRFEKDYLGRGPTNARSYIIDDMILVRLEGMLTPAEQKLSENNHKLVKETRRQLFELSRPFLEELVQSIFDAQIISLHTDMSSKTGERVVVLTLDTNLNKKFSA